MTDDEFRLPAAIPEDLPADETALLSFVYRNGYTLKSRRELASMIHAEPEHVAAIIRECECKGWLTVRYPKYSDRKTGRMIIPAF